MIVGIDLLAINKSKNHGIGNFAEQFARCLLKNHKENQYILLNWSDDPIGKEVFGKLDGYKEILAGECRKDEIAKARTVIETFVQENGVDFFLDMSPLWGERPLLQHNWFGKSCQLTGIVYDFIPYVMRDEEYFNNRPGFLEYLHKMFNLHQYDHLFPISAHTKTDANIFANVDKSKMTVVYCSTGENRTGNDAGKFFFIQKRLGIHGKYFLYPAGDAPHKNIPRLLLAYKDAQKGNDKFPKLVITGKYGNASMGTFDRIIDYYGMRESVIIPGYLTSEELSLLYHNAFWVLYPSLYEGFGMPVLEAWNHAVPVLASISSSIPEIAENAAVLVEPTSTESISKGLRQIFAFDEDERKRYIALGQERASIFRWEKTVDIFASYIKSGRKTTYDENEADSSSSNRRIEEEINKWDEKFGYRINAPKTKSIRKNAIEGKDVSYLYLLDDWLSLWEHHASLEKYFTDNKYKSIAIYGMGIIANRLITELGETNIEVKYAIDRGAKHMIDVLAIKTLQEEWPKVDAIVVTAIYAFDEIKEGIEKKAGCPIISMRDIINYMLDCCKMRSQACGT